MPTSPTPEPIPEPIGDPTPKASDPAPAPVPVPVNDPPLISRWESTGTEGTWEFARAQDGSGHAAHGYLTWKP